MALTLFYIIIGIIIAEFIFSNYLSWLNTKSWKTTVPTELQEFYDEDKYRTAQEYAKANKQLSIVVGTLSFIGLLAFLFYGGFAYIDNYVSMETPTPWYRAIGFFGILMVLSEIFSLPFSLYKTFVIEEKFGFNKTTVVTYISDKIKGYILTIIVGGGLIALMSYIFDLAPNYFWLIAWGVVTAFSLFMTAFYTSWFLPLFNKLSPLQAGELRSKIEEYSKKVDFPLNNIFVMDASKRSSKANAFFSGIGSKKSIVLYDTLIKEHSTDELVAVLAHEVGHYKRKHIFKNQILSILSTGIVFFILGWALNNPNLSGALGADQPSFHMGLVAFSLLYSPISMLMGIFMNRLSRKYEYEADDYAKTTSDANALKTCLKKMSVHHLSNLQPHPAYVYVNYSHPPLLDRLKALNS